MATDKLMFKAGVELDQASINTLKKSLDNLLKINKSDYLDLNQALGIKEATANFNEMKDSVRKVKEALSKSYNADLGTTNISKFNQELKKMDISKIARDFNSAGAQGRIAFKNMTTEILTTNLQLKQTNKFLNDMATTMGNTIKWGITSSIFNNITGSVQKAYGYVKDLDSSLNNIRIVSGQSAAQMEDFAKQANNAAQALGSTTTKYTDAALIYYQQGLGTEEVIERTNATIKMANVLGESADKVSSYMTAIWNNFDDGSKSMEYFGDVVTALGASTAASSEEIAVGLEKFASVAETAGLSYEYATSALATVVATTRQSADTVGTAFKTIFARIQGLNLGETLDDGTTLNKYSKALAAVGISIKDQNGELKAMDNILDEMGAKWQTLNKDQQLALAQTVAGTRQYNQLVSLMNNWDFMKENIDTARNATGTLEEQQATYMESLEAHLKSLKAAQENVFDSLFDADSFKSLVDVFTKLTNAAATFIDGIGGGGTALLALGSIGMNVFNNQIGNAIGTLVNNFQSAKVNLEQIRAELEVMDGLKMANLSDADVEELIRLKSEINGLGDLLNESQKNEANTLLKQLNDYQNQQIAFEQELAEALEVVDHTVGETVDDLHNIGEYTGEIEKIMNVLQGGTSKHSQGGIVGQTKEAITAVEAYRDALQKLNEAEQKNAEKINDDEASKAEAEAFKNLAATVDVVIEKFNAFKDSGMVNEDVKDRVLELAEAFKEVRSQGEENGEKQATELVNLVERVSAEVEEKVKKTVATIKAEQEGASANLKEQTDNARGVINNFISNFDAAKIAKGVTTLISGVGQLTTSIMSLKNIGKIIDNDNISAGEKFGQVLSALSMALTTFTIGLKSVKNALIELGIVKDIAFPELAAIVAITTGVIALGVAIANITSKEEKLAQRAKATAEALKKATEEAKKEAQELKSTFDGYDSVVDKLNSCTIGTQEWRDALAEVNDKVLEILDKYPQLLSMEGALEETSEGLRLTDAGRQALEDSIRQKVETTSSASIMANAASQQADFNVDFKKFSDKVSTERSYIDEEGIQKYYDFAPIIKQNIDTLSKLQGEALESKLNELFEGVEEFKGSTKDLANEIVKSSDDLRKLGEESAAVATALDNASKVVVDSKLGDAFTDTEKKMASFDYAKIVKDIEADVKKENKNVDRTMSKDNSAVKDLWNRYNKAIGREGNEYELQDNAVRHGNTNRTFHYYDDNNKKQDIDIDSMAKTIAAAEALEQLTASAESARATLNHLDETVNDSNISNGIKDFIANRSMYGMTSTDLTRMQGQIDESGGIEAYLDKLFGSGDGELSQEEVNALGFTSAEEMIASFEDGMKRASEANNI